jgi:hypothetical protein
MRIEQVEIIINRIIKGYGFTGLILPDFILLCKIDRSQNPAKGSHR